MLKYVKVHYIYDIMFYICIVKQKHLEIMKTPEITTKIIKRSNGSTIVSRVNGNVVKVENKQKPFQS